MGRPKSSKVYGQEQNIFRLFYLLKRAVDAWGTHQIERNRNPHFHISFMPFFMNMRPSGISNNELASLMGVTKQAASRIVKGLTACGYVRTEKNLADARSSMLFFTSKGAEYYQEMNRITRMLQRDYAKVIGPENYNNTISGLLQLITYHENNLPDKFDTRQP